MFHAKTTSTARDLFYRYDTLAHFHDAQFKKEGAALESYISYEALGEAILLSLDPAQADPYLPDALKKLARPSPSVVLIDEIHKAPRDLPNDVLLPNNVLNEIEQLTFTVRETGRTFAAADVGSYEGSHDMYTDLGRDDRMAIPVQQEKNIGTSNIDFIGQIYSLGPSRSQGRRG